MRSNTALKLQTSESEVVVVYSPSVHRCAARIGVSYFHFSSQFRIIDGSIEIKFVKESLPIAPF